MLFAHGQLLPDSALPGLLAGLGGEINETRATRTLVPETVIAALDTLGRRLAGGEFDDLLKQYLPAGTHLADLLPLLSRETLEEKLRIELGEAPFTPRPMARTTARLAPLGTLLHVAAGNMPGLPVYSVVEGLLTGNVNLLKLPRGDKGLSMTALKLLTDQVPELAPFVYAFDLPSSDRETLSRLAILCDGIITWGSEGAVTGIRALAPAGCKLIEWGHRLGFVYLSGRPTQEELTALAQHIITTSQRLCSSCQTIFLNEENWGAGEDFCRVFLPILEAQAAQNRPKWGGAQASLSGYTALLERILDKKAGNERLFAGRGCSLILRPDRELELSPMEGNVLVKLLPKKELLPALRRQKGRLQTAGLICPDGEREELTDLLIRAGLTRITGAGSLSDTFPGEGHDGEYPLRRYTRIVDVEQ